MEDNQRILNHRLFILKADIDGIANAEDFSEKDRIEVLELVWLAAEKALFNLKKRLSEKGNQKS
jgi:hypothetical protein